MKNFELLNSNIELNQIIDSINEIHKDDLFACHGRYHTTFVMNTMEKLLTDLNYNSQIVELGKIAGLLHDIGTIEGKKGHAKRSSELCVPFLNKTTLSKKDKDIIIHAIEDHSSGNEINSAVGAVLLIADKIDLSKNRVLDLGKKDEWYCNLLNINGVIVAVQNDSIVINYLVNNEFSFEFLLEKWKKGITIPIKACHYLGYNCIFQLNGNAIDLDKYL